MKRALILAVCFSLVFASALWAFAGCEALAGISPGHDHGASAEHSHDHGGGAPHSGDSGKIHCPDLFGALWLSAKVNVPSTRAGFTALAPHASSALTAATDPLPSSYPHGPPGWLVAGSVRLHQRLAVLRI